MRKYLRTLSLTLAAAMIAASWRVFFAGRQLLVQLCRKFRQYSA